VFVTTNYDNSENDSHEKDCYFIKFYFIDSDWSLYRIKINIDVDECRIGVYYNIVCSGPAASLDFALISSWKHENTILLIPYENWKHMKEVVKDFKGYCKIKDYHIR